LLRRAVAIYNGKNWKKIGASVARAAPSIIVAWMDGF
jgi:hypothetical protein